MPPLPQAVRSLASAVAAALRLSVASAAATARAYSVAAAAVDSASVLLLASSLRSAGRIRLHAAIDGLFFSDDPILSYYSAFLFFRFANLPSFANSFPVRLHWLMYCINFACFSLTEIFICRLNKFMFPFFHISFVLLFQAALAESFHYYWVPTLFCCLFVLQVGVKIS